MTARRWIAAALAAAFGALAWRAYGEGEIDLDPDYDDPTVQGWWPR